MLRDRAMWPIHSYANSYQIQGTLGDSNKALGWHPSPKRSTLRGGLTSDPPLITVGIGDTDRAGLPGL